MNDQDIVLQFLQGNKKIFEMLLDRYEKQIYIHVLGVLVHQQDALDVTQEIFIKVYENLHALKNHTRLKYWIYQIAINYCRNFLRRKNFFYWISFDWLTENNYEQLNNQYQLQDFEQQVESQEDKVFLMKSLEKLSYQQRELIMLRFVNELSYEEMQHILGLKLGTVKSRLNRAKKDLKRFMLIEKTYE